MQKRNSNVILNPGKAGVLVSSSLEENEISESSSICESEAILKSSDFHGKPESLAILNAVPSDAETTDVTLVPVLDETTKKPLTLIPNSKSGIQIFRTRSESAAGQTSLNALKFVLTKDTRLQVKNTKVEENLDEICPLKKRGRLEATDHSAEEIPSEKRFTYLKVAASEAIQSSSSSQSMTDHVIGGCDPVIEGDTSAGVLSQGRALTNLVALPIKRRQIQPACGKENVPLAIHLNVAEFGLQKFRQISDSSRHSGITFPLFSSFESGSMTEIQYGAPSSYNVSNLIHNPFSISSTSLSSAAAAMNLLTVPSSISKFAVEQNDRIASSGCPVVRPMGFIDGIENASPACGPKLIFLKRLPSGGVEFVKERQVS